MSVLINISENPISQKHISWSYREDCDEIMLDEIVENIYRHPDAPDHATIFQIEKIEIKRLKKTDFKAASILLLKHALDNCSQVNGQK